MAVEQGQVIAVEAGRVWVKCQTQSACTSCSTKSSCGTSVLAKAFPVRTQEWSIETADSFEVGQSVTLTIADQALLTAALWVYLLPLLGLLLGALAIPLLVIPTYHELSSIIGGLLGLAIGLAFARRSPQHQQHSLDEIQIKSE